MYSCTWIKSETDRLLESLNRAVVTYIRIQKLS